MPTNHTVKEGESLITIAKQYGFLNWRTIYDAPENAELRRTRGRPNAILPGDVVSVPDKKPKKVSIATTKEHVIKLAAPKGVWKLEWKPAKGYCGDKAALEGETNLPPPEVELKLTPRQGASPGLPVIDGEVNGQKIKKHTWVIKNVWLKQPFRDPFPFVELDTTTKDDGIPSNVGVLKVESMAEAPEDTFTASHNWSGFTMNPSFKQKIVKFVCKVSVHFDILKCWGAYWVNLTSAGVTGTAGGCPWAGHRWARATGANAMAPNEYHDGTAWRALPAGFALTGTNHSAIGFYKSGASFVSTSGGTWPGTFADYNFNSKKYKKRRKAWIDSTHEVWSHKFHIRRKTCKSSKGTRCCIYTVDVALSFTTVNAHAAGVIAVCPGALRSNASIWFLDDSRIEVAAHEAGHHMDNPDEYAGGAVDPSLNGDGAVNGIDADCIMGANLTKVKKRHYHAFCAMVKKLIKAKYGRDYDYIAVQK